QIDHTIGQFMEYARPATTAKEAVDISEVIAGLAQRERSVTEARGGTLDAKIEPNLWSRIAPSDIQRAVSNLIENARKYGLSPDGTAHIELKVFARGQKIYIEVQDNGPGISEEERERLVRPFVRGTQARTDAGGAGLGLAIVRRLIAPAAGTFDLKHRPEGGLSACILLPRSSR